jgi:hypothetical protein
MLNPILVLGLCLLPAVFVHASEAVDFDAPSGKYDVLYEGPIATDLFVGCDFTVSEIYAGTDWPSSVAVVYSTLEDGDDENEELVKLEAMPTADGKGWRYFFTIVEEDDRNTQIVSVPQRSDLVLRLSLARLIEGAFVFVVGNEQDYTSVADVSRLTLMSWRVIASGVKGSAFCSNDPTSMPSF